MLPPFTVAQYPATLLCLTLRMKSYLSMKKPHEHLEDALESLKDAREEAGIGTSMMIQRIIEELEPLVERTRRNEEEND